MDVVTLGAALSIMKKMPDTAASSAAAAENAADRAEAAAEQAEGAIVVDDTLSIKGRAADAKKTGDKISDLKGAFSDFGGYISDQVYFNENVYDGVCDNIPYVTSTGQPSSVNLKYISASNLISVNAGDVVSFESFPANFTHLYCLFYFADKSYSTYAELTLASPYFTVPQNIKYFRFEFNFSNDTPASTAERWIIYINKTQTTKARITEINAHLDKTDADIVSIMTNGDTYTPLTKKSTVDGKKAYLYNGALVVASGGGYSCNIYEIKKGNKYKVYGFGYDRSSFYIACIGATDIITDGSTSTEFLGNIECGTDEYPAGYTYHTVVFTATQNGYLYVNYQTSGDEAALSVADKVVKIPDEISNLYTDHGVYIADGNYYYFKRDGESYIIRKFNRRGPNNLFQWTGLYIGDVDGGIQITSTIAEYTTDIVGPISIFNTSLWPGVYGMWSGGNHDVTVNSEHYATAEQDSFTCMVNGKAVSANGLYYGDVEFATKNKLYFPQSITGADFSTATLALNEYRSYRLSDQMDVRVRLEFMADARVTTYYGMQCVTTGFTDFLLANNEYYGEFADLENEMAFAKQENKIYMTGNGLHFDMELRPLGLGNYERNDGQSESLGYFYLPKQVGTGAVHKAYFVCIRNANQVALTNGTNCVWEGRYSVYR